MSRYAVPLGGLGAIVSLALVLIVLVVLRPWSGPDRSLGHAPEPARLTAFRLYPQRLGVGRRERGGTGVAA